MPALCPLSCGRFHSSCLTRMLSVTWLYVCASLLDTLWVDEDDYLIGKNFFISSVFLWTSLISWVHRRFTLWRLIDVCDRWLTGDWHMWQVIDLCVTDDWHTWQVIDRWFMCVTDDWHVWRVIDMCVTGDWHVVVKCEWRIDENWWTDESEASKVDKEDENRQETGKYHVHRVLSHLLIHQHRPTYRSQMTLWPCLYSKLSFIAVLLLLFYFISHHLPHYFLCPVQSPGR